MLSIQKQLSQHLHFEAPAHIFGWMQEGRKYILMIFSEKRHSVLQ